MEGFKSDIVSALAAIAPMFGFDHERVAEELFVQLEINQPRAGAATPQKPTKPVEPLAPKKPAKPDVEEKPATEKPAVPAVEEDKTSEASKKERARTVSKKMKEKFAELGGTEEQLKEAIKKYKDASNDEIKEVGGSWDAFAAHFLGKPSADKPKKPRFKWTPTSTKLFTETITGSGGTMDDTLKDEFVNLINNMSSEDFDAVSVEGHMRAFAVNKFAPPSPALQRQDAVDDEEEDLEEIDHDGEKLLIGTKSGKIYRPTEEAGDVLIGVAGQGRFKDVKTPSA